MDEWEEDGFMTHSLPCLILFSSSFIRRSDSLLGYFCQKISVETSNFLFRSIALFGSMFGPPQKGDTFGVSRVQWEDIIYNRR